MINKTGKGKKWISVLCCFLIASLLCGCQHDGNSESEHGSDDSARIGEAVIAYAEYLQQFCDNSDSFTPQRIRYALIYIDGDQIPELAMFDDDSHPSGAHICVYQDGEVIELGEFDSFGSFSYSPYESIFMGGFSNMGETITKYYMLYEGQCIELQSFHSYPQYDENNEYVQDIYEVDGYVVSEEEDREAWEQWEKYGWESIFYDNALLFTDQDSAQKEMEDFLSALPAEK